jgi:uncharacterized RDD family membrane protein YckC
MTETGWVYWIDGEHGPFGAERVAALIREGAIQPWTDMRPADRPAWTPAQTLFPDLFPPTSASEMSDPRAWSDTRPHPWRRFAARTTDTLVVGTTAAILIAFVGYLISPERTEAVTDALNSRAGQLLGAVIVLVLVIPFNALTIGLSGLTLGKWIFGVRVLKDAKPIGVFRALRRELGAFAFGLGGGLPLISLVTLIYNFRNLSTRRATPWDRDQNLTVVHRPESLKATVAMILAVIAVILAQTALRWASQ